MFELHGKESKRRAGSHQQANRVVLALVVYRRIGDRRMTTYRMPRQVALKRYLDAQPVPGTVEIRNLPTPTTKS
jgi:hypothetical protein